MSLCTRHLAARLVWWALAAVAPVWAGAALGQTASTTSISWPDKTAAYEHETVRLQASVSPSTATGTLTFRNADTGQTIATVPLQSGVATADTEFTTAGMKRIYADYNGGPGYSASTSIGTSPGIVSVNIVAQAVTSTSLAPGSAPVDVGQDVVLTATISGRGSAYPAMVSFFDGATPIGAASGTGSTLSVTVRFTSAGSHALTASYGGNVSDRPSTSAVVNLMVNPRASGVALSANPSPSYEGQAVTLQAAVNGTSPTGSVTFKDGSTTLGTAALSAGVATLGTSFSATGVHGLTAIYAGDANHLQGTSSLLTHTVNARNATATSFGVSPNPITVGQQAMLTATVAGANPSGTVTFKNGATVLGTASLVGGSASLGVPFMAAGTQPLSAVYGGDASNTPSTSTQVNLAVDKQVSTTGLTISPASAFQGQRVTLTATVAGYGPTGSVTFMDGATTLGSALLIGGSAILSTSLTGLNHTLVASYAGDANNQPSSSSTAALQTPPVPPNSPPVVRYEYDAMGNPTKRIVAPEMVAFGLTTTNTYDSLNRRRDTTDARNGKTVFSHDGLDRVLSVTDPRNLVTRYTRNGLGDMTQLASPDTGTASHTFDAAGNPLTRTDSRGVLATYSHDALNRPTAVVYSQSGQASVSYGWTYDQTGAGFSYGIGRLTTITHPGGSARFAYSAQGWLTSTTQTTGSIALSTSYGRDAAGRVNRITYPSGRVLSIGYADGMPTTMSLAKDGASAAQPLLSQIDFQPFGAVKSWLWHMNAGTVSHVRGFDLSARMVRYPLGALVRDLNHDVAGQLVAYSHVEGATGSATPAAQAMNQGFAYDQLGRITQVTMTGSSWTLSYDANGNRTGVTLNGTSRPYTIAATSNRLQSIANPSRAFTFDNAGNTLSDSDTNLGYTATYGLDNGLTTLTRGKTTATYAYNNFGQRVKKDVKVSKITTTTLFVYGPRGELLGEYEATGKAIREYVWLGDVPVAVFMPDPANAANPPLVFYVHTDHLNTPRVVVDRNNRLRWRWMAEPFGTTAAEENPSGLGAFVFPPRFPGQYFDQESGLHYNHWRYYDPVTGRYITPDPIGLDGGDVSLYPYVSGDPLSFVDPTGLVKHTTGRWIDCGKGCRIRIDHTLNESTGGVRRHLHWECKGKEGTCGEHGEQSHGESWDSAPEHIKQCALRHGFNGASVPAPPAGAAGAPMPYVIGPRDPSSSGTWNPLSPPLVYDPRLDRMVPGRDGPRAPLGPLPGPGPILVLP